MYGHTDADMSENPPYVCPRKHMQAPMSTPNLRYSLLKANFLLLKEPEKNIREPPDRIGE